MKWYDYDRQCWVEATWTARVLPCGHTEKKPRCYACHHAGEEYSLLHTPEEKGHRP